MKETVDRWKNANTFLITGIFAIIYFHYNNHASHLDLCFLLGTFLRQKLGFNIIWAAKPIKQDKPPKFTARYSRFRSTWKIAVTKIGNINADYVQLLPLLLSRLEEVIIRILSDFGYSFFIKYGEQKIWVGEQKKRESLSVYCGILKVRVAAASLVLREALMLL